MPSRLPIQDIFAGLVTSIGTAIRYWFHYTLVAFAWLGVVPLTACKYNVQFCNSLCCQGSKECVWLSLIIAAVSVGRSLAAEGGAWPV